MPYCSEMANAMLWLNIWNKVLLHLTAVNTSTQRGAEFSNGDGHTA